MGANVVVVAGGEIMRTLRSGAIDGSEWVGPWLDTELGLHTVLGHYYYPGFHEPGTNISVGINKGVWESFDDGDRRLIEAVAASEYARSLAEFNTKNALALQKLRDEGTIKILKFPIEGLPHDQQRCRRGDRLCRRTRYENLCELPAVSRVHHKLERHCRTRRAKQSRPLLIAFS
jgi:TRAP-type mannitol/chloroaromatic compound transport system substrate-binding protein